MQLSGLAVAAIFGFASTAIAQVASVVNDCDFPIYVQYNVNDGPAGTPTEVDPNSSTSVSIASSGGAILVAQSASMNPVLNAEYGLSDDGSTIYYDLSNAAGNPFDGYTNNFIPSNSSCPTFSCGPDTGDSCYSTPDTRKLVIYQYTCAYPVDLTAQICAPAPAGKRRVMRRF